MKVEVTHIKDSLVDKLGMNENYRQYLQSDEWRQLRLDLILKRGDYCERCRKKTKFLHVHHITYARIFHEIASDLVLLCPSCHAKIHGLLKPIPTNQPKCISEKERIIRDFLAKLPGIEPKKSKITPRKKLRKRWA